MGALCLFTISNVITKKFSFIKKGWFLTKIIFFVSLKIQTWVQTHTQESQDSSRRYKQNSIQYNTTPSVTRGRASTSRIRYGTIPSVTRGRVGTRSKNVTQSQMNSSNCTVAGCNASSLSFPILHNFIQPWSR